ncbi:MAG TPA: spermidine/putrescine ABC transporter substrate-binding protein [Acidimicrobiales bacterium]|jgi:spermidine/putrescine transport system substrate-binding protein|nr:spermidine/putrescine ABC transporter substrate-binding protein [Acidimicrobiales bacterium]
MLRAGGIGAGLAGLSALLSACGIAGSASRDHNNIDWASFWHEQKKTGVLNFANWPLYIDSEHGKSESIDLFSNATGIKVNYEAVIQGDAPFYATVEPLLAAQESTGYDIIVITSGWYLTQLINSNFLVALDHAKLGNFTKYASPLVKNPNYDPGNKFSVTWQTGFTGIAYNTKIIKRPITSFEDLSDPAFKGHVGMMNDNTEVGSAALLHMGVSPANSTHQQWKASTEWLKKQRELVLGYYDQSYIQYLENEDTWITQAWSGDVFQANLSGYPHLKYVVPKEGQMVWHDNMLIPRQAQDPLNALDWMNFYYTPKIAGIVADWVNYVCPVPQAKPYIANTLKDPTVANSPLVFPPASIVGKSHDFYVYKDYDDYETWNDTYNPIIE